MEVSCLLGLLEMFQNHIAALEEKIPNLLRILSKVFYPLGSVIEASVHLATLREKFSDDNTAGEVSFLAGTTARPCPGPRASVTTSPPWLPYELLVPLLAWLRPLGESYQAPAPA